MKKEKVSAGSGVLHSVLNELHNCCALEACEAPEAEVALVVFNPHVSDKTVEFECEAEDVVMVAAVPHYKAAIRLSRQYPFSSLARQRSPVPASLQTWKLKYT